MKQWKRWGLPALLCAAVLVSGAGLSGCKFSADVDGITIPDVQGGDDDTSSGGDTSSGDDAVAGDDVLDAGAADDTAVADVDGGGSTGSCEAPSFDPTEIVLPDDDFFRPFAVAATDELVFVANTNLPDGAEVGPGFVTVIDRATKAVVNRIPTSQYLPVALAIYGEKLVVVNQGKTTAPSPGVIAPETDGGVELLDIAVARDAATFDRVMPIPPAGSVGAPHSIAVTSDGEAYVGSGSVGVLFVADVAGCDLLRGSDDPLEIVNLTDSASLTPRADGQDRLWIADARSSLVHLYDPKMGGIDDAVLAGAPFAASETAADQTDADIDFHPGASPDVFVLLEGATDFAGIDSATGTVTLGWNAAGTEPVAAHVRGEVLYVLDRVGALRRRDLAAGTEQAAFALLPGAEVPNRFAITPDGAEAWVVDFDASTVSVVDLTRGAVTHVLGATALDAACQPSAAAVADLPAGSFASPTAALYAGGLLYVTNTNPDAATGLPGQGFVTVVHPDTLAVVNRIPTSQPNPQHLATDGRWLYVVNTGIVDADPGGTGLDLAVGGGGIDVIDLYTGASASAADANVSIPISATDARMAAPGAIHLLADGTAYVGSTTGPFVFSLDLSTCALAADPIIADAGVGNETVTPGPAPDDQVALVLADLGRLLLLDPSTDTIGAPDYSFDPAAAPFGAGTVIYRGAAATPNLFVLLAEAGWVAAIDSTNGAVTTEWAAAGTEPTRMAVYNDALYVVDATDDGVRRVDMNGGAPTMVLFPAAAGAGMDAGPYDIAIGELLPGDWRAFVTNRGVDSVSAFRLSDNVPLGTTP